MTKIFLFVMLAVVVIGCWFVPQIPSPEPEDVPAIMVEAEEWECLRQGRSCPVTNDAGQSVDASEWYRADTEQLKHLHLRRASCTDKSRVLLTSEDGKNWCHKVNP